MVRVGDDQLAGVGVGRGNAESVEGRRHQHAGEQLAEGQHVGVLRRSDGFLGGNLGGQFGGFGHAGVEFGNKGRERRLNQHLAGGQDVAGADGFQYLEGLAQFAARGKVGNLHQLIGDAAHGADDQQRLLGQARGYDGGHAANGGRILNRGPAEFHDDHTNSLNKNCA